MEHVRVTDVSPRDGLQNEAGVISSSDKVRLIELLDQTGVDEVELTSFVSPKWVPQLGDAEEVCMALASKRSVFSVLVPNAKGMEAALRVHEARPGLIDKVSVFAAASETFSRQNTNADIGTVLERFVPVIERAHSVDVTVRGYISCVIACPFEGPIAPERVVRVAERLVAIGVDEIDLGDTIGAATPESLGELLAAYESLDDLAQPLVPVTLHLHDTFGVASDCVKVALQAGVRSFDAAVAGLGGCPYASTPTRRAPGNLSTHALVQTILQEGFDTSVHLPSLDAARAYALSIVQRGGIAL